MPDSTQYVSYAILIEPQDTIPEIQTAAQPFDGNHQKQGFDAIVINPNWPIHMENMVQEARIIQEGSEEGPSTHADSTNIVTEICPSDPEMAQNIDPAYPAPVSPHNMDPSIQQQGRELHEVLSMFRNATTMPLSSCILPTPAHKSRADVVTVGKEESTPGARRESPRLKAKGIKGKNVIKMA